MAWNFTITLSPNDNALATANGIAFMGSRPSDEGLSVVVNPSLVEYQPHSLDPDTEDGVVAAQMISKLVPPGSVPEIRDFMSYDIDDGYRCNVRKGAANAIYISHAGHDYELTLLRIRQVPEGRSFDLFLEECPPELSLDARNRELQLIVDTSKKAWDKDAKPGDMIRLADAVIERVRREGTPTFYQLECLAGAMALKAKALTELNRLEEAHHLREELVRIVGSFDTPFIQAKVLESLANNAHAVAITFPERRSEVAAFYGKLLQDNDRPDIALTLNRLLARIALKKAMLHYELKDWMAARESATSLISRWDASVEPEIVVVVAGGRRIIDALTESGL